LSKIQARLGDLHDLSVAQQLLERLPKKDIALVDAIALTQNWLVHKSMKRGKLLRKSLKRLSA
jgi:CHAD domain-containing protein